MKSAAFFATVVFCIPSGLQARSDPFSIDSTSKYGRGNSANIFERHLPKGLEPREIFQGVKRDQLPNKLAHYQFDVRLGPGDYDAVRIHRVVREGMPYNPIRTKGAVFMLHGSKNTFSAIFLRAGSEKPKRRTSVPIFLAMNRIDVWGLDYGWALVPEFTKDLSFMQNWGLAKDAVHVLRAMAIARFIRGLTMQGDGPMNLLGYSYSVLIAYIAAGWETQLHPLLRSIRGLIAVDYLIKASDEDEEFRLSRCQDAEKSQEMLDRGVFHSMDGVVLGLFSHLAKKAPNDPSPFFDDPELTNYEAVLSIGAVQPFWHSVGGIFDREGIPSGLSFSDPERWIRLLDELPPYQPMLQRFELQTVICDEVDVAFDDHLDEITVPILYLGAAGGLGRRGLHTSNLTAGTDKEHYVVEHANLDPSLDFGHVDLFTGYNAIKVWRKLLHWLFDHPPQAR